MPRSPCQRETVKIFVIRRNSGIALCLKQKKGTERPPFPTFFLSPSDWPTYVTERYESVSRGSTAKIVRVNARQRIKKRPRTRRGQSDREEVFRARRTCRREQDHYGVKRLTLYGRYESVHGQRVNMMDD